MEVYSLYFDGSCGPKNPGGTAAYGFKLYRNGEKIQARHGVVGQGSGMSNNLAEFAALYHGLSVFAGYYKTGDILNVRGDSNLVIKIMSRLWKAKSDKLYYNMYVQCDKMVKLLRRHGVTVNFDWIPREANQECDNLSKTNLSAKLA